MRIVHPREDVEVLGIVSDFRLGRKSGVAIFLGIEGAKAGDDLRRLPHGVLCAAIDDGRALRSGGESSCSRHRSSGRSGLLRFDELRASHSRVERGGKEKKCCFSSTSASRRPGNGQHY